MTTNTIPEGWLPEWAMTHAMCAKHGQTAVRYSDSGDKHGRFRVLFYECECRRILDTTPSKGNSRHEVPFRNPGE